MKNKGKSQAILTLPFFDSFLFILSIAFKDIHLLGIKNNKFDNEIFDNVVNNKKRLKSVILLILSCCLL